MKKDLLELLCAVAIAVIASLLISHFVASTYKVNGLSMYPTFNDSDRVVVSKISKTLDTLDNGDVIVFHRDSRKDYIKRLIGKPGDIVTYKNDILYVNGKKINEPYLEANKRHKIGRQLTEDFSSIDLTGASEQGTIPKDKYLVLGDNRQNSIDSRRPEVGLISEKKIVGKVVLRYWPVSDFKLNFDKP
ncbi:signal peptidase I [Staphylococcus americanisciuri]|uniref:Signal peptidase I n=1 Tax=Staphylococcus americanisciuri TaxID=2973940 RepID=A0ABT2F3X0_9STAP|nr:signal peptidase I [Staphylococcus americanisciuri]MCS4486570.1 signal peptidase I [Staphylococcus americanisciuri]